MKERVTERGDDKNGENGVRRKEVRRWGERSRELVTLVGWGLLD